MKHTIYNTIRIALLLLYVIFIGYATVKSGLWKEFFLLSVVFFAIILLYFKVKKVAKKRREEILHELGEEEYYERQAGLKYRSNKEFMMRSIVSWILLGTMVFSGIYTYCGDNAKEINAHFARNIQLLKNEKIQNNSIIDNKKLEFLAIYSVLIPPAKKDTLNYGVDMLLYATEIRDNLSLLKQEYDNGEINDLEVSHRIANLKTSMEKKLDNIKEKSAQIKRKLGMEKLFYFLVLLYAFGLIHPFTREEYEKCIAVYEKAIN